MSLTSALNSLGLGASLLLFGTGFLCGYLTSTWVRQQSQDDLQKNVAVLVTFAYVASLAATIAIPSYSTSIPLHGIMGAVVGYLFQSSGEGISLHFGRK